MNSYRAEASQDHARKYPKKLLSDGLNSIVDFHRQLAISNSSKVLVIPVLGAFFPWVPEPLG